METQESTEATQTEPTQETVTQEVPQEEKADEKPEGWDQVEFTPEQQKRFGKVYKDLKTYQRETHELRTIAKQQFEIIEQLRNGQTQIVNHLQEKDYTNAESILKNQRLEAYNRGDLPTVDAINDRLLEIRIQKKLAEKEPKQQTTQQSFNAENAVNRAVQTGQITHDDAEAYQAWANETDDYGNLKRPWVNEYDSRNQAAAIEGRAVFNNPAYRNKPFAEKLKEIDRRMGVTNQRAGSNVLPAGNLTRQNKTNIVKLSPYQEQVAVKTKFAGPGKSPQEHIEAYKAQVAAVRGNK